MQTSGSFITVLPIQTSARSLVTENNGTSVTALDLTGNGLQFFSSGTGVRKQGSIPDVSLVPIAGADTVSASEVFTNLTALQTRINLFADWLRQSGLVDY